MAANTLPIYTKTPSVQFAVNGSNSPVVGASANTSLVLASAVLGTDVFTVFTADATNGSYLRKLRFKPGVHGSGTTITVARLFINNGSAPSTAANNVFWDDLYLPAITPAAATSSNVYEVPVDVALPAGYRMLVAFGTASANGWQVTGIGGHY